MIRKTTNRYYFQLCEPCFLVHLLYLGLPFYQFIPSSTSSTLGTGGSTPTSSLFNCGLSFDLIQSIQLEKLYKINILNPQIMTQNINDVMRIPSVLGMDILSRYYLSFDANSVTLEK